MSVDREPQTLEEWKTAYFAVMRRAQESEQKHAEDIKDREADRAAIRDLDDAAKVNSEAYRTANMDWRGATKQLEHVQDKHAATIQRAQDAKG